MDDRSESLRRYRAEPGRAAATAWWKSRLPLPGGVRVVHADDDPRPAGRPERYFKLVHHLDDIPPAHVPTGVRVASVYGEEWVSAVTRTIAAAYDPPMAVDEADVRGWRERPVACPELWLGAFDDDRLVGTVIADLDSEVGEAILEWMQVLPDYRHRGIARALVTRALEIARDRAEFAVVAGDAANETGPERVYRACGFQGEDVWHVYRLSQ